MSGSDAHIVRYHDGRIERMQTPDSANTLSLESGLPVQRTSIPLARSPAAMVSSGIMMAAPGATYLFLSLFLSTQIAHRLKAWGNGPKDVIIVGRAVPFCEATRKTVSRSSTHPATRHSSLFTMLGVSMPSAGTLRVSFGNARWWGSRRAPPNAGLIQGVWATDSGDVWATGARSTL